MSIILFSFFKRSLIINHVNFNNKGAKFTPTFRQRPYHIEHTSSRPITEVKQC